MTKNRKPSSPVAGACAVLALLVGACVGPPKMIRVPVPPLQIRTVLRPAGTPVSTDWHDMPATAGAWHWNREGGNSVSRFANPQQLALLSLTCDSASGQVTIARAAPANAASTMSIYTTSLSRALAIRPAADGGSAATLSAHDPLLDAMAFSRGRFAVVVPGLSPLYLPSWPEVGRVIEDCR